jgi:hypothetical protein
MFRGRDLTGSLIGAAVGSLIGAAVGSLIGVAVGSLLPTSPIGSLSSRQPQLHRRRMDHPGHGDP